MSIITIRGQLGSGAPEIGKLVAGYLHYDYIDRDIIANVAARLNSTEKKIAEQEMPPTGLVRRILDAIEHSYPAIPDVSGVATSMIYLPVSHIPLDDSSYLTGLISVIKDLAAGNSIVIQGRGSQFILKDYPDTFHVLVIAPLSTRIEKVMASTKMDEKSARQAISRFDNSRHEFIKRYFKAEIEDPINYHLVINTKHLDYQDAAHIITDTLSLRVQTENVL